MKCTRCGAENAPENKYCEACGAPLEAQQPQQPQQTPQPDGSNGAKDQVEKIVGKVKSDKKLQGVIIKCAGALVAVVIVIILIAALTSGGSPYDFVEDAIYPIQESGSDEVHFLTGGAAVEGTVEDGCVMFATSLDGSVTIMMDENGDIFNVDKNGVSSMIEGASGFFIASSGKSLVYLDEDNIFYLYNIKNGKKTKITDSDEITDMAGLAISPDGKYVAYTIPDDDYDLNLYVFDGKKSTLIDDALIPIALSNGGKYIYCYNTDNYKLYVYNMKGAESKKVLEADVGGDFILNKDHTQLMFTDDDDNSYISIKGGDPIKLRENMFPALPEFTQVFVPYGYSLYYNTLSAASPYDDADISVAYTIGVDTFADLYFMSGDSLGYLNSDWEYTRVASSIDTYSVSDDGKTAYYIRNDDLYRVTTGKLENPDKVAEDVSGFSMKSNGSAAYYLDNDDVLWYCKGTGKPKRIADDVVNLFMAHDETLFFLSDYSNGGGTLYSSKNGGKRKTVMEDAYSRYIITPTGIYIWCDMNNEDSVCDIYGTDSGTDFTLVIENVDT